MQGMSTSSLPVRNVLVIEISGEESLAQRADALRRVAAALEAGDKNGTVMTDAVVGSWQTKRAWRI